MIKKKLSLIVLYLIISGLIGLQAQNAVPASGGNASGSSGTVSYTIGQVVYTANSENIGSVAQGVQQPYEISNVGIEETKGITLQCSAFPNPAYNYLKLKVDALTMLSIRSISYQLYEMNGKLLQNKKAESNETIISMESLAPATYFLIVTDNNKKIKSFKIIKN